MKHAFKQSPVTLSFIILSFFFSCITWFGYFPSVLYWFVFDKDLILDGQIWRAITPIFLHFPAMGIVFAHLAFNMIWFYDFGTQIERADSSRFLFFLVLFSGLLSNLAQSIASEAFFGGMSGVVYALLGYLFVRPRIAPYPVRINETIAYFLIGFMLIAGSGLLGDGIANTAHFVGFAFGVAAAFIRAKMRPSFLKIKR